MLSLCNLYSYDFYCLDITLILMIDGFCYRPLGFVLFLDSISLLNFGLAWDSLCCYGIQVGLEPRDLPTFASTVLGSKVCATLPGPSVFVLLVL